MQQKTHNRGPESFSIRPPAPPASVHLLTLAVPRVPTCYISTGGRSGWTPGSHGLAASLGRRVSLPASAHGHASATP